MPTENFDFIDTPDYVWVDLPDSEFVDSQIETANTIRLGSPVAHNISTEYQAHNISTQYEAHLT